MFLAVASLLALVVLIGWCLRRWSVTVACLLAVASALWLPANNGHLEGPVLATLDRSHGLTLADLLSYFGFIVVVVSTLYARQAARHSPRRDPASALPCLVAPVLLAGGLLLAYLSRN